MGYKLRNYECSGCGHEWEDLMWNDEVPSHCPRCNDKRVKESLVAPGIAAFSLRDKNAQWDVLRKRSEEHTAKMKKRGEVPQPRKKK